MKTIFFILGIAALLTTIWFKFIRRYWLRNSIEDRWLAAQAINELLYPSDYWGNVEEFSSIPVKNDKTLKSIQTTIKQLFDDPSNFIESPSIGKNEYPILSDVGRDKVTALGRALEKELPNYSFHLYAKSRRTG